MGTDTEAVGACSGVGGAGFNWGEKETYVILQTIKKKKKENTICISFLGLL